MNVDDLGWKDVGFMGSDYYETPNLDRLASGVVVFIQGYAAGAICTDSRGWLMIGQNAVRRGVYRVSAF